MAAIQNGEVKDGLRKAPIMGLARGIVYEIRAELRCGGFAHRLLTKLDHAGIAPISIQIKVMESVLIEWRTRHINRMFVHTSDYGSCMRSTTLPPGLREQC